MKIIWTSRAIASLSKIHEYIAKDNLTAANDLRDKIIFLVDTTLATQPLIGRSGRVDTTREKVIHSSYIVVYKVTKVSIEIITIRHTSRQWPMGF